MCHFSQSRCFQKVIKNTSKKLSTRLPKSSKIVKQDIQKTYTKKSMKNTLNFLKKGLRNLRSNYCNLRSYIRVGGGCLQQRCVLLFPEDSGIGLCVGLQMNAYVSIMFYKLVCMYMLQKKIIRRATGPRHVRAPATVPSPWLLFPSGGIPMVSLGRGFLNLDLPSQLRADPLSTF